MKIKNIILSLIMLFAMVGCFKDKGNYDYTNVPNILASIPYPPQSVVGDEIPIEVILRIPEGYSSEFKYEWVYDMKPIEGSGNKIVYKTTQIGNKKIGVTVTDLRTNAKYFGYTYVNVTSLFKNGFVVLVEDGANTDFHFIPSAFVSKDYDVPTSNDSIIFKRECPYIFKNTVNQTITGKPIDISEHFLYEASSTVNEIILTTETAGKRDFVALNGETLKTEVTIKDEFTDATLPTNFSPKSIIHSVWDSYIINEDNSVYSRRSASNKAYHVGEFDKDVKLWGKGQLSNIFMTHYRRATSLLAIEIDPITKERSYVGINAEYSNNNSYNQLRLPQQVPHEDFINIKDEVVFDDYFKIGEDAQGEGVVVMKNSAGDYILHIYTFSYIRRAAIQFTKSKKVNLTQQYGITNVKGMFTSKVQDHRAIYFYDDNNLYCYESFEKQTDILTTMASYPNKSIAAAGGQTFTRANEKDDTIEPHIAIGFTDGSFEIHMLHFNNPAKIEKKVFQNTANYGKIVKILYKEGGNEFFATQN